MINEKIQNVLSRLEKDIDYENNHRDLHLSIRRQRQMCIRDRSYVVPVSSKNLGTRFFADSANIIYHAPSNLKNNDK